MSEASEPFIDPLLGTNVGAYAIEERIGEGGMAVVYRARDPHGPRSIALKVFQRAWAQDPRVVRRFVREARIASALDNPNTVTIHDFGEADGGVLYIAMELLEGRPLRELIAERGRLAPALAAEIAVQICRSLVQAHEHGVVHRDLKPDNVYLTLGDQGQLVCKVLDYGVARVVAPDAAVPAYTVLTQIGTIVGTPPYMAPEQARAEEVDARTDLYSLGVMLFEMLAGRLPFFDKNPIRLLEMHKNDPAPPIEDAPALLGELVARMLAKSPDDRPASAKQVITVLDAFLVTASPDERRLSPGEVRDAARRDSSLPTGPAIRTTEPEAVATKPEIPRTPRPVVPSEPSPSPAPASVPVPVPPPRPAPSLPSTHSEMEPRDLVEDLPPTRVRSVEHLLPRSHRRARPSRTGPVAAAVILALGIGASIAIAWSQRSQLRSRALEPAVETHRPTSEDSSPSPSPSPSPSARRAQASVEPEREPENGSSTTTTTTTTTTSTTQVSAPSVEPEPEPEPEPAPEPEAASASAEPDAPIEDWSGNFRTQEGMLRLTQSGDRVTGLFGRPGRMGRIWGRVEGGAIEFRWVIRGGEDGDDEQGRGRLRRVETDDGTPRWTASLGQGDSVTGFASWNIWLADRGP